MMIFSRCCPVFSTATAGGGGQIYGTIKWDGEGRKVLSFREILQVCHFRINEEIPGL